MSKDTGALDVPAPSRLKPVLREIRSNLQKRRMQLSQRRKVIGRRFGLQFFVAAKTIAYRRHIQAVAQAADEVVFYRASAARSAAVKKLKIQGAQFVNIIKHLNCMLFK